MIPAFPPSPAKLPSNRPEFPASSPAPAPWSREFRLHKHADYQSVYKRTRKQFSSSMSWFAAPRAESQVTSSSAAASSPAPRVGLTVGKVIGKAHERNRIKRRLREVVRHAMHELPEGVDVILHPKRSVMEMDFGKLEAEVLRIFRQASGQIRQMKQAAAKVSILKAPHGPKA